MPRLDRDPAPAGPVVRGFSGRAFLVGDTRHDALLLTPDGAAEWNPPTLQDLGVEHLAPLLAMTPPPEFLILGTGATMAFPPRALATALDERSIGIEAMDSRAAARIWGTLRAEGRWIAAALLPL